MTGHMRLGFHAPDNVEELADLVAEAVDTRTPLEVMGRGTKREVGRPVHSGAVVSTESLVGVSLYEPSRTRARRLLAGTPIGKIEEMLAESDQMLPSSRSISAPCLATAPARARSAGWSPPTSPAAGASLPARRATICSASKAVNGRGEMSSRAAG